MRSVFIIGPDKKVKLTLTYPASTGRHFGEILRVLDSLQLTAAYQVATPGRWRPGEDVIIMPAVSHEDAACRFPDTTDQALPALDRAAGPALIPPRQEIIGIELSDRDRLVLAPRQPGRPGHRRPTGDGQRRARLAHHSGHLHEAPTASADRRRARARLAPVAQALGAARSNDPQVLFLDEPTAGLDPIASRDVHELIAGLGRSGVTIFLTTHRLEEAERLCDRVAILNTTLRTIGRPDELRDRLFTKTLTVRTLAPLAAPDRLFAGLPAVDGWRADRPPNTSSPCVRPARRGAGGGPDARPRRRRRAVDR